MAQHEQREPIATVVLKIYSTRQGHSSMTLSPAPSARQLVLSDDFHAVISRELRLALAAWGSAG
jgi:hypothetical protein